MTTPTESFMEYMNDEHSVTVPTKWVICTECKGEGHHSKDFGAFTSSDLDEWYGDSSERDEFVSDYMSGRYDHTCTDCNGTGKVKDIDTDDPFIKQEYESYMQEVAECRAIEAAERAAGC